VQTVGIRLRHTSLSKGGLECDQVFAKSIAYIIINQTLVIIIIFIIIITTTTATSPLSNS